MDQGKFDFLMRELYAVNAETMALQLLLTSLCKSLISSGLPNMDVVVAKAFDDATNTFEHIAIARGKDNPPTYTERTFKLLEHMRTMTMGDSGKPKDLV